MSILDALERAKIMGQQRQALAATRPEAAVRSSPATSRSPVPPVPAAPAEPREVVEFARLAYDPLACAEFHIIVPDVDPLLAQSASAPYRMLRTRVLQRCRASQWSSIAITSPGPGQGKSVTALNLGISIAREGNYDVFLLDLDMRNPSVCRYLGVTPRTEMSHFLAGHAAPRDVLFSVGIDRLFVGGNVAGLDNSSELLATGRLAELFSFIHRVSANPLLLIDVPPVLVTDDALVVAPSIDAFLLVASEGVTRRDGFQRATEMLADYPIAGVVLNRSHEMLGGDYYAGYGGPKAT